MQRSYDGDAAYTPVRRSEEETGEEEFEIPVDVNVSRKGRIAGAGVVLLALTALAGT
jgi:hypothetical protein